ncbi:hypothetical protein [Haloarcula brevis]|uniref:hypothetical protein n=1 Tax=Haloarcula brevis TaxID=3111453 RepID=UPI00300F5C99
MRQRRAVFGYSPSLRDTLDCCGRAAAIRASDATEDVPAGDRERSRAFEAVKIPFSLAAPSEQATVGNPPTDA